MKTRVLNLGRLGVSLFFCLGLAACNNADYYEKKDFLTNPYQSPNAIELADANPQDVGGFGVGDTQGGVDSGVNGGTTSGGTTSDSSSGGVAGGGTAGGGTAGGGTAGGSTTGGTVGGDTTGGVAGGGTAGGTTTGGSNPVDVTENFIQKTEVSSKLDIMWVIDNSGSMADEQEALVRNFSAFIHEFINKNIDFKMAITTTDGTATKKGLMVPNSDVALTSAKAASDPTTFFNNFASMITVGTRGSGNEKGLEGTEGFLNRYGSTFLRPDAYLAVVIVSDEEDQSAKVPSFYTDYLKSFKATAGLVKMYSIVDTGLTNSGTGIKTGFQRYADATNLTAGIVSNIRDDFAQILATMGDSLISLLDSFALASDPIPGTLKVYIDDVLTTDYTFDAASRSIKFAQGNLPAVGARIRVTYQK